MRHKNISSHDKYLILNFVWNCVEKITLYIWTPFSWNQILVALTMATARLDIYVGIFGFSDFPVWLAITRLVLEWCLPLRPFRTKLVERDGVGVSLNATEIATRSHALANALFAQCLLLRRRARVKDVRPLPLIVNARFVGMAAVAKRFPVIQYTVT